MICLLFPIFFKLSNKLFLIVPLEALFHFAISAVKSLICRPKRRKSSAAANLSRKVVIADASHPGAADRVVVYIKYFAQLKNIHN